MLWAPTEGFSREKATRPLQRREEGLQTAASQTGTQADKDMDVGVGCRAQGRVRGCRKRPTGWGRTEP